MNWIIFTFFGAFFQNLRSSLQKKLNKDLSLIASSYVRFVFALPFGVQPVSAGFCPTPHIASINKSTSC